MMAGDDIENALMLLQQNNTGCNLNRHLYLKKDNHLLINNGII